MHTAIAKHLCRAFTVNHIDESLIRPTGKSRARRVVNPERLAFAVVIVDDQDAAGFRAISLPARHVYIGGVFRRPWVPEFA